MTASLPNNLRVTSALSVFERKLAWRYVFRKDGDDEKKTEQKQKEFRCNFTAARAAGQAKDGEKTKIKKQAFMARYDYRTRSSLVGKGHQDNNHGRSKSCKAGR